MSILNRTVEVLPRTTLLVGQLDYSAPGCYRNVEVIPFKVRPNRRIRVDVESDSPVEVAVANDDGSTNAFRQSQTEGVLGPFPTGKNDSMALVLGLYPGDRANVTVRVTMSRD
jgi:hypothetical protein